MLMFQSLRVWVQKMIFPPNNRFDQSDFKSYGFTKKQYKHMLNLFQQPKVSENTIASGSAHLCRFGTLC